MNVSLQTQAILLMTVHFDKLAKEGLRPLSPVELAALTRWLRDRDISLGALLTEDITSPLAGWSDTRITFERISCLLARGVALGLALEKWQRAGLWVLTPSEVDYPSRLKNHLKVNSPSVLFGCGNPILLNQGGIGVVGSRDASADDLAYAGRLGQVAAQHGLSVISGGARGVDEAAMLGALEREGTSVGVLADSLLRLATSAKYRKALMASNLVLISPYNPEAGFDVGNAMARNKYVYCLSDAVVVVSSNLGKGGTWNGAVENLKHRWVPLWVKSGTDNESGNVALVQRGAQPLPYGKLDVKMLYSSDPSRQVDRAGNLPLVDNADVHERVAPEVEMVNADVSPTVRQVREAAAGVQTRVGPEAGGNAIEGLSFYDLFLLRLEQLTARGPVTVDYLQDSLAVNRGQLNDWVKRALDQGHVEKLNRPVRYRPAKDRPIQGSIFGQDQFRGLISERSK